jgi:hypothetical protein
MRGGRQRSQSEGCQVGRLNQMSCPSPRRIASMTSSIESSTSPTGIRSTRNPRPSRKAVFRASALRCECLHQPRRPGGRSNMQSPRNKAQSVPAAGICTQRVGDSAGGTRRTIRPWSCCCGVRGHARLLVGAHTQDPFFGTPGQPRLLTALQTRASPPGGALRAAPSSPQGGEVNLP